MANIYDLSWKKDSFISKFSLFIKSNLNERKRIKSKDNREKARGYSALSSTYYSIVCTTIAKMIAMSKINSFWLFSIKFLSFVFLWSPLGLWCAYRMFHLSNKFALLIKPEDATSCECNNRQSILRYYGKYDEVERWIELGFKDKNIELHTIAFLCIGRADVNIKFGNWEKSQEYLNMAFEIAETLEKINSYQAVRIYEYCAILTDYFGVGEFLLGDKIRRKAEDLARIIGSKNQIIKLKN